MATQKAPKSKRFDTSAKVKNYVWCRAAGHCELCSKDLTKDLILLTLAKLGEVAHIIPASPAGPRSNPNQTPATSEALTNDPKNLMLLCANCHNGIDKTADGYPQKDLSATHEAFVESIMFAANHGIINTAAGIVIIGKHFTTPARIDPSELQKAMWRDHLRPVSEPLVIELPELDSHGRDSRYYDNVRSKFRSKVDRELTQYRGELGDDPIIGIAGIADIPSLIICGQELGDRIRHKIYSSNREKRLNWPDANASVPGFTFVSSDKEDRVHALVISISAEIPERDVIAALPDCEISKFTTSTPSYDIVKNEKTISEFGVKLQEALSKLEASSTHPIHVFAAIPAAMAIKFGSLLSTNHRHKYQIYDRDTSSNNAFTLHLSLN